MLQKILLCQPGSDERSAGRLVDLLRVLRGYASLFGMPLINRLSDLPPLSLIYTRCKGHMVDESARGGRTPSADHFACDIWVKEVGLGVTQRCKASTNVIQATSKLFAMLESSVRMLRVSIRKGLRSQG